MPEDKKTRGIYERERGSGTWWIRYTDAQGRRRREKVGRKTAANNLLAIRKAEALEGKKLPANLRTAAVKFRELVEDAVTFARAHNSWLANYEGRGKVVKAWFGDRAAEDITPQDIDAKLSKLAEERNWAPATFNRYKALISLAYRLGMENQKIKSNPARLVRHRKENNARLRFLSIEEESKLRAVIPRRHIPEFDVALHTGMRLSEQYRLERSGVSLERRLLTISRSKNGEVRHIPLNARAVVALQWILGSHADGHVFPHHINATKGQAPRWFGTAVEKAGIAPIGWHGLRHTFASRLVMAGVDIRTVQELMGHKSILMTMRYAHLAPDHQQAAVEKLVPRKQKSTTMATAPRGSHLSVQ